MRILAIDTATENCSAALLIDGSMQSREIEMERGHAERILPMIDDLLAEAGISLQDLGAIAFGRGPGSFTGVRLAVTVTQGLAFGANLGVVPVSDLRAVAQRAIRQDPTLTKILVCNDARMSEVYWACFERGGDGLARLEGEEHVTKPSDVKLPDLVDSDRRRPRLHRLRRRPARRLPTVVPAVAPTLLTTAAVAAAPEPIPTATIGVATPATPESLVHLLPHAIDIAFLSAPDVAAGRLIAPEAATPIYLRDNVAHVAQPPKPPGHAP